MVAIQIAPAANLSVVLDGTTPGSGYGQINFNTALTPGGNFTVSATNGFVPSPGNRFQVLTYPSVSNQFNYYAGLDLGNGILLQPNLGSSSLTLIATTYATNATKPQLFINPTLGGMAVIWPAHFSGWTLQSTTNLASHTWVPVSNVSSNQGLILTNIPQQYFRLKQTD